MNSDLYDRVLDRLRAVDVPETTREIADALNVAPAAVQRQLNRLTRDGHARNIGFASTGGRTWTAVNHE